MKDSPIGNDAPHSAAAGKGLTGDRIEALQRTVRAQSATIDAYMAEMRALRQALSHDLQAPLRAITGFSALLRDDAGAELPHEWGRYLEHIHDSGRRMSERIEALLRFSEIACVEMVPARIDLSAMVRAAHLKLAAGDCSREVALHVEDGVCATGDARLLRILLEALLDNAWRYTAGVEAARVEFGTHTLDGVPEYWLRDNGIGFDMAYVDQLFVPFRRVHSPSADAGSGMGMGLAIARRIVHRHGGTMRAESRPGDGAMFAFTLVPPVAAKESGVAQ